MGVFSTTELQRRLVASPLFVQRVPDAAGAGNATIRYGTAGFRMAAPALAPIAARMGPLLAARAQEYSQQVSHGSPPPIVVFGAMITASHNPSTDNGLKLVEPSGHMLSVRWEARATELARTHVADGSDFLRAAAATLQEVASRLDPAQPVPGQPAAGVTKFRPFVVLIGQDTRPSGPEIADSLAQSVRAFGGLPILCGMMTTPMLHYIVMRAQQAVGLLSETASTPGGPLTAELLHTAPAFRVERWSGFVESALESARRQLQLALVPAPNQLLELVVQAPQPPPVDQYFEEMADCFVVAAVAVAKQRQQATGNVPPPMVRNILVDCANGAGALSLLKLQAALDSRVKEAAARGHQLPLQLTFELVNKATDDDNALNDHCGADFVQKTPSLLPIYTTVAQIHRHSASPHHVGGALPSKHLHGIAYSLDGDADRIVGLTTTRTGRRNDKDEEILSLRLLDGDRFTSLFATAVLRDLKNAASSSPTTAAAAGTVRVGAVQTAYANGAATEYLASLPGLHVACALTGVKHVHAKAEEFDIGIYFESNGHGTVLVQPQVLLGLGTACPTITALASILSPCCGDAVANLLAAEYALYVLDWWDDGVCNEDCSDAAASTPSSRASSRRSSSRPKTPDHLPHHAWVCIYEERPSVQLKVKVGDVARFACAPTDERQLVTPPGAQEHIMHCMHEFIATHAVGFPPSSFRTFARPSGTEPIVRVYAEGPTQELASGLGAAVEKIVQGV